LAGGSTAKEYVALDCLRGVAAVLVLIFHFRSVSINYSNGSPGEGALAVDFFFALSGFVLYHVYAPRFGNGLGWRRFMVQRLIRFYPLYFLGLVIGTVCALLLIALGLPGLSLQHIATALPFELLFLPSMPPQGELFAINTVAWSLFFELVANLVFALGHRLLKARYLVPLIIACAAALAYTAIRHKSASVGVVWEGVWFGLPRVGFSFALGILLRQLVNIVPNWRLPFWLFLLCIVELVVFLTVPVPAAIRGYFDLSFIFLASPLLILAGALTEVPQTVLQPMRYLGRISYPLYTIHLPAILVLVAVFKAPITVWAPWSTLAYALAYAVCMAVIAAWLDRHYDLPVRRFLTNLPVVAPRIQRAGA
jgi:peptidoglycan/LPS O-acetylase OafA/YrhL